MKRERRHVIRFFPKATIILAFIILLPYSRLLFSRLFPDLKGEIRTQSVILRQKLLSSNRLEVTRIEEEGVMVADTSVIILGTVGKTTIRYRYSASIGIDLSEVDMVIQDDSIVFLLPEPVIMNDGIDALEINKKNMFSYAIDKKTETLLQEQKEKCRETYMADPEQRERILADVKTAFEKTICEWLDDYGERHYRFLFEQKTAPS